MSQKTAKRIRREGRVNTMEAAVDNQTARLDHLLDTAMASVHETTDTTTERNAERRRARQAERTASAWRILAYAALVVAILAVHAAGADTASEPTTSTTVPVPQTVTTIQSVQEDFENERIEAALLAQAHMIEECVVTHYDCCVECCGKDDGITASGVRATPGVTVAVDPDVIPLGADVLVDYGDGKIHYYRADDTGGAVRGNHIDLCVGTHDEALQLGRRTATVYWVAQEGVS